MTTPTDRDALPAEAALFDDLAQPSLAEVLHAQQQDAGKRSQGSVRLLEPNRTQIELRASDLESLLSDDHRARLCYPRKPREMNHAVLRWRRHRQTRPCRKSHETLRGSIVALLSGISVIRVGPATPELGCGD